MSALVAMSVAISCGNSTDAPQAVDYEMSYTVGDASFDMIKVPAGHFTLGLSTDNRRKVTNGTPQEVALDGFVISAAPVSQALWTAVMGSNPSSVQDPSAPVDMVSWNDAQKFVAKLGKATGKTFSLPTEAQWEYAAKLQNAKGFGTLAEWCQDTYDSKGDYFNPSILMVNPQGPAKADKKVIRTMYERLDVDSHTSRAKVGFRIAQPTEEVLSETLMSTLDGTEFERETINAQDGVAETFTVGGVTFKMVKVKGGEFKMGFNEADSPYYNFKAPENEKNVHSVTVSDYEIGETEVTVALWNAVMGSIPYLNDIELAKRPVGNISWYNCQNFISKLNELTGRKFRLPTEAEWEYAARGGSLSRNYGYSGSNDSRTAMWFVDNADMKPQDVKTKKANELGLYDMSGNVWEWCFDRAADYTTEAQVDPVGPAESDYRILRGGSAASRWDACRITNRSFMPAKNVKGTFGMRLAL